MNVIRQSLAVLQADAQNRPPHYLDRLLTLGTVEGELLVLTPENYLTAVKEFSPQSYEQAVARVRKVSAPEAVAYSQWPTWARVLSHLATAHDTGLGDTVARVIGPIGGDAFKAWSARIGFECGCSDRQDWLNHKYPLPG